MKKLVAIALVLAAAQAHAQTNAGSDFTAVQPGRIFHCQLMQDLNVGKTASCRLTSPLLRDDHVTVAVGAGSWLNGAFDGTDTVQWEAVQTGESVGSTVFVFEHGMESTVHGNKRAGDELLVAVTEPIAINEELSPPALALSVSGANTQRSSFYESIMEMSSSDAGYTFMVDELLSERCGKQQGIPTLKEAVLASKLPVLLNLKDGNVEAARKILANLPCER